MVLPFDQIYIISLKKSTNRRKHLFEEFNRIGGVLTKSGQIPTIVDANNGCKYSHYVDNSTKRINRKQNISQGEIGCFASHRAVWMQFLESDAETCLILEDDVRFGMNFQHLIEQSADKYRIVDQHTQPAVAGQGAEATAQEAAGATQGQGG